MLLRRSDGRFSRSGPFLHAHRTPMTDDIATAALDAPAKRSSWSLGWRVASGLLFVPILILLAWAGGWALLALVATEVTLGLVEFYRMMREKGLSPYPLLGHLAALGVLWKVFRPHQSQTDFLVTAALLLTLGLGLRRPDL